MSNGKGIFIAIDPGTSKCGLALLNYHGNLLEMKIVETDSLASELLALIRRQGAGFSAGKEELTVPDRIVIGNGTFSSEIIKIIKADCSFPIVTIDEQGSTLKGRSLWLEHYSSHFLWRNLPTFIKVLFEPSAMDAYAAWALGLEYLKNTQVMKTIEPV